MKPKRSPLRSTRRIVGGLFLIVVAQVAARYGFVSRSEIDRIGQRLGTLSRLLKQFGPFTLDRFIVLQPGLLSVQVKDNGKGAVTPFDRTEFEAWCQKVDRVSTASRAHLREQTIDTRQELEEAEKALQRGDIKAVRKIVAKMHDEGGLELVGKHAELVRIGPPRSPFPVRQAHPRINMEMHVVSRTDFVRVITDQGEFLVSRDDPSLAGLRVGDVAQFLPSDDSHLVHCVVAEAAVMSENQLTMEFPRQYCEGEESARSESVPTGKAA